MKKRVVHGRGAEYNEFAGQKHVYAIRRRKTKNSFCICLCHESENYLLGEPSSNLDAEAIEALRQNIRLLRAQRKTIRS
ncbi:MAG: hypothetical protein PHG19_10350 [Anaerotignum sp.]|nr:hypothetical protein [Anaerotignum sp.]